MEHYTIILTEYKYGQIIESVEKNKVRQECERLKKAFNNMKEKAYVQIEVANLQTGEVREYWNNHDNKINF